MGNPWKRFAAWGTGLKGDLFVWARIKLSALYLLIVAVILAVYSVAIYTNVSDHARDIPPSIRNPEEQTFYDQAVDRTMNLILAVDGAVLVAAAGLSYLLAGYTLRPIKEALDAQTAFSADASHELRTPLTVMRTNTEVLLRSKEPLSEKTQRTLRSNLEEIRSMSQMTEQLLALSRGHHEAARSFAVVDLRSVVAAIAEKFAPIAADKHIILGLGQLDPANVSGDVNGLRRILQNVVANAIAYTPAGGSVSLSLTAEKGEGIIRIADTGIGIAQEDIPRIFERFYKADPSRTGGGSGNGLGLSIVKKLVEDHGGTIAVESAVGKGTTFYVKIPLVPA